MGIGKIISGGQRGADQAAIIVARSMGVPTGGTACFGFKVETYDGQTDYDPWLAAFGLVEGERDSYPYRTRRNVETADLTIWIGDVSSPGGRVTARAAKEFEKRFLINPTVGQMLPIIQFAPGLVINVAGNRLSPKTADIFAVTAKFVGELIRATR